MDEDRLPWQAFDCSLARSAAEDGSATWGCHDEGSGDGTAFRDLLNWPHEVDPMARDLSSGGGTCFEQAVLGRVLFETLLPWNLRSPDRLHI
eukprot:360284-Chlamydomonas_euryale.AAC.2